MQYVTRYTRWVSFVLSIFMGTLFLLSGCGKTVPVAAPVNTASPSRSVNAPAVTPESTPEGTEAPLDTDGKDGSPDENAQEGNKTAESVPGPDAPYSGSGSSPAYHRESHHYGVSVAFPSNYAVENTLYLKVVINAQLIYVYRRDSAGNPSGLVRTIICSTGMDRGKNATPLGKFMILDSAQNSEGKHRWVAFDGSYGQYATRLFYITDLRANGMSGYFTGYMFHSELYRSIDPKSLMVAEYNTLGYPRSHGCVRMQVKDARWIYMNAPTGSIVEVIDGSANPSVWASLKPPLLPYGTDYDPSDPAKPGVDAEPNLSKKAVPTAAPTAKPTQSPKPTPTVELTPIPTDEVIPTPEVTGPSAQEETPEPSEEAPTSSPAVIPTPHTGW